MLKVHGKGERGERRTKSEIIKLLWVLPCSDTSPSSQLLIDQLVDTCPVQPGCLPTSTDQPRESKNSRKCGWTFLEDSTFFKIWNTHKHQLWGEYIDILKTDMQKLLSFEAFDKSRPSSEWIWEWPTTVKMSVLWVGLVSCLDRLALVSASP